MVQHLIQSFQRSSGSAMAKTFRVNYKRHVLTMDDLSTLYGQNWLNDQVQHCFTLHSTVEQLCVITQSWPEVLAVKPEDAEALLPQHVFHKF